MRALTKVFDLFCQFKSSSAHSTTIIAAKLTALLSPWAGDASLYGDKDVVKQTIVRTTQMATRSCSLVSILGIHGVETIVEIFHGRRAGRCHGQSP